MTAVTAATVIAGVGVAASVAGTVASMSKSSSSAGGQRQAAEDTYQAAVLRNQQLEMQADEIRQQAKQRDYQAKIQDDQAHLAQGQALLMRRDAEFRDVEATLGHRAAEASLDRGNEAMAISQRSAIESKRKSAVAAGRAKAVMAASGGGVDHGVLASILGEGDYAANVAMYEGKAKERDAKTEANLLDYGADVSTYGANVTRYNADVADYGVTLQRYGAENTRYQATLDRRSADHIKWYGGTVLQQGSRGAQALYAGADYTDTMGYAKAGVNALSIAAKYAPAFMGGGSDDAVRAVGGAYTSSDAMRMAGGAGLGGVRASSDYGRDLGPNDLPEGMVA